jgi:hypothetical protein
MERSHQIVAFIWGEAISHGLTRIDTDKSEVRKDSWHTRWTMDAKRAIRVSSVNIRTRKG